MLAIPLDFRRHNILRIDQLRKEHNSRGGQWEENMPSASASGEARDTQDILRALPKRSGGGGHGSKPKPKTKKVASPEDTLVSQCRKLTMACVTAETDLLPLECTKELLP
jgi:hypothetical protein